MFYFNLIYHTNNCFGQLICTMRFGSRGTNFLPPLRSSEISTGSPTATMTYIHSTNASARLVSGGSTAFITCYFEKPNTLVKWWRHCSTSLVLLVWVFDKVFITQTNYMCMLKVTSKSYPTYLQTPMTNYCSIVQCLAHIALLRCTDQPKPASNLFSPN